MSGTKLHWLGYNKELEKQTDERIQKTLANPLAGKD